MRILNGPTGNGRMSKVDRWGREWAVEVLVDIHKSNYSSINVVERILRDPGIATDVSQHKILWWPKNRRVARVSKAAHQLTAVERIILIVHWGHVLNDDGTRLTKNHLAQKGAISVDKFLEIKDCARRKLSKILRGYDKNGVE